MSATVTIITSCIAAFAAIIVGALNSYAQNRKIISELDKHNELQAYRIEQLEKKVDKHNNLVERTYKLEQSDVLKNEKISVANHRIEDLEKKVGA